MTATVQGVTRPGRDESQWLPAHNTMLFTIVSPHLLSACWLLLLLPPQLVVSAEPVLLRSPSQPWPAWPEQHQQPSRWPRHEGGGQQQSQAHTSDSCKGVLAASLAWQNFPITPGWEQEPACCPPISRPPLCVRHTPGRGWRPTVAPQSCPAPQPCPGPAAPHTWDQQHHHR